MEESSIAKIFRDIRGSYLEQLTSEFARLRSEQDDRIYTEAALRKADGEIATEGEHEIDLFSDKDR